METTRVCVTLTEKVINRWTTLPPHHRDLHKGDRTRTRSTAPQTRTTEQDNPIAIIIHEQYVPYQIDKSSTLFRKWNGLSVRTNDGNTYPTITTQGSPFDTTPYDSGSLPCDTVGWTNGYTRPIGALQQDFGGQR